MTTNDLKVNEVIFCCLSPPPRNGKEYIMQNFAYDFDFHFQSFVTCDDSVVCVELVEEKGNLCIGLCNRFCLLSFSASSN